MSTTCNTPFRPSGILLLISALSLSACGGKEGAPPAPKGAAQPPVVTVITAQQEPIPRTVELPGRTAPYLIAELRPQVNGIIKARKFEEGSLVEAGQLLYQIDPSIYQAALDGAKASLERAEANVSVSKLKAQRAAELVKINAVSKEARDDAQAALKQAQADVALAKAAVDKAKIDLGYTRLSAPISGRIGRSAVTPGALVTANQTQALATVQQLDPIYVDLTQSSAELMALKRDLDSGKLQRTTTDAIPVKLLLEDGSIYPLEGKLAFSEVTVNQDTGSVTLRAVFPNPKGDLLPGMYVRARLAQGVDDKAIRVPQSALMRDAKGEAMVMLVNAEGKVEPRPVKTLRASGGDWIIAEGLSGGERVMVAGLQKARPGTVVKAEMQAESSAPNAAPQAK
ncbi:MAG: efflux RND transporter periplasmic adaptor subunit [Halothiobacillaceae bacterium]